MTDLLTEQAPAVMEIAPLIEALDMLNDTHECDASQSEASCSQYGGGNGDSSQSQHSVTENYQADHSPQAKQKRARTKAEQISAHATKHQVREVPERCRRGCKNKCLRKIPPAWRASINQAVNKLSKDARRQWYRTHVRSMPARYRRKENAGKRDARKKNSFRWTLPVDSLAQ